MERTFDTPEPIQLYVELGSGEVRIDATDTTTTEVTATGPGSDDVTVEQPGRPDRGHRARSDAPASSAAPTPRSS